MAENERLKYQYGFANLIGACNKIHTHASRDITELTDFGIDQQYLDDYEAEIDEFEEYPSDEELLTDWMAASNEKNRLRKELEPMLTKLITRAKLVFGRNSAEYKQFRLSSLPTLREDRFLSESRRLKRAAEEHLAALAAVGLTQAMIDDIDGKTADFETAMEQMSDAAGERTAATAGRIAKANAIYDKMMSICSVGKAVWHQTSKAKWNDYVVYRGAMGRRKKNIDKQGEGELPSEIPSIQDN